MYPKNLNFENKRELGWFQCCHRYTQTPSEEAWIRELRKFPATKHLASSDGFVSKFNSNTTKNHQTKLQRPKQHRNLLTFDENQESPKSNVSPPIKQYKKQKGVDINDLTFTKRTAEKNTNDFLGTSSNEDNLNTYRIESNAGAKDDLKYSKFFDAEYVAKVRSLSKESKRREEVKLYQQHQQDLEESRRRDHILSQRRQQLTEATERYLRSPIKKLHRKKESQSEPNLSKNLHEDKSESKERKSLSTVYRSTYSSRLRGVFDSTNQQISSISVDNLTNLSSQHKVYRPCYGRCSHSKSNSSSSEAVTKTRPVIENQKPYPTRTKKELLELRKRKYNYRKHNCNALKMGTTQALAESFKVTDCNIVQSEGGWRNQMQSTDSRLLFMEKPKFDRRRSIPDLSDVKFINSVSVYETVTTLAGIQESNNLVLISPKSSPDSGKQGDSEVKLAHLVNKDQNFQKVDSSSYPKNKSIAVQTDISKVKSSKEQIFNKNETCETEYYDSLDEEDEAEPNERITEQAFFISMDGLNQEVKDVQAELPPRLSARLETLNRKKTEKETNQSSGKKNKISEIHHSSTTRITSVKEELPPLENEIIDKPNKTTGKSTNLGKNPFPVITTSYVSSVNKILSSHIETLTSCNNIETTSGFELDSTEEINNATYSLSSDDSHRQDVTFDVSDHNPGNSLDLLSSLSNDEADPSNETSNSKSNTITVESYTDEHSTVKISEETGEDHEFIQNQEVTKEAIGGILNSKYMRIASAKSVASGRESDLETDDGSVETLSSDKSSDRITVITPIGRISSSVLCSSRSQDLDSPLDFNKDESDDHNSDLSKSPEISEEESNMKELETKEHTKSVLINEDEHITDDIENYSPINTPVIVDIIDRSETVNETAGCNLIDAIDSISSNDESQSITSSLLDNRKDEMQRSIIEPLVYPDSCYETSNVKNRNESLWSAGPKANDNCIQNIREDVSFERELIIQQKRLNDENTAKNSQAISNKDSSEKTHFSNSEHDTEFRMYSVLESEDSFDDPSNILSKAFINLDGSVASTDESVNSLLSTIEEEAEPSNSARSTNSEDESKTLDHFQTLESDERNSLDIFPDDNKAILNEKIDSDITECRPMNDKSTVILQQEDWNSTEDVESFNVCLTEKSEEPLSTGFDNDLVIDPEESEEKNQSDEEEVSSSSTLTDYPLKTNKCDVVSNEEKIENLETVDHMDDNIIESTVSKNYIESDAEKQDPSENMTRLVVINKDDEESSISNDIMEEICISTEEDTIDNTADTTPRIIDYEEKVHQRNTFNNNMNILNKSLSESSKKSQKITYPDVCEKVEASNDECSVSHKEYLPELKASSTTVSLARSNAVDQSTPRISRVNSAHSNDSMKEKIRRYSLSELIKKEQSSSPTIRSLSASSKSLKSHSENFKEYIKLTRKTSLGETVNERDKHIFVEELDENGDDGSFEDQTNSKCNTNNSYFPLFKANSVLPGINENHAGSLNSSYGERSSGCSSSLGSQEKGNPLTTSPSTDSGVMELASPPQVGKGEVQAIPNQSINLTRPKSAKNRVRSYSASSLRERTVHIKKVRNQEYTYKWLEETTHSDSIDVKLEEDIPTKDDSPNVNDQCTDDDDDVAIRKLWEPLHPGIYDSLASPKEDGLAKFVPNRENKMIEEEDSDLNENGSCNDSEVNERDTFDYEGDNSNRNISKELMKTLQKRRTRRQRPQEVSVDASRRRYKPAKLSSLDGVMNLDRIKAMQHSEFHHRNTESNSMFDDKYSEEGEVMVQVIAGRLQPNVKVTAAKTINLTVQVGGDQRDNDKRHQLRTSKEDQQPLRRSPAGYIQAAQPKKNQKEQKYPKINKSHSTGNKTSDNRPNSGLRMGSQHQVFNSLQSAIERSNVRSNNNHHRSPDTQKNHHTLGVNKKVRDLSSSSDSKDFIVKKMNYSPVNKSLDRSRESVEYPRNERPVSSAWSFTSDGGSTALEKIPFSRNFSLSATSSNAEDDIDSDSFIITGNNIQKCFTSPLPKETKQRLYPKGRQSSSDRSKSSSSRKHSAEVRLEEQIKTSRNISAINEMLGGGGPLSK